MYPWHVQFIRTAAHESLCRDSPCPVFFEDVAGGRTANCRLLPGSRALDSAVSDCRESSARHSLRALFFHLRSCEVRKFAYSRSDRHGKQSVDRRKSRDLNRHQWRLFSSTLKHWKI